MSLIILEQGALSFGGKIILNDINLRVSQEDRIGIIGPNGAGKSTLLKILAGQQGLDSGELRYAKHCRTGYLPQDVLEVGGDNLLSSIMDAVPGRSELSDQIRVCEQALTASTSEEEQLRLASTLSRSYELLDHFETFFSSQNAVAILLGLGFREKDFERPTRELSGGWKMRAALARLLFQGPDVLLLDEPTNHLDIPSVEWLNFFLKERRQALVLICHDRVFLNDHVNRIVSFEPEGVRLYAGNFDTYEAQRMQEETLLEAQARNQEREVRELERFVERFRAKATKARQAQSRARLIEKMQREMSKPIVRPKPIRFSFPPTMRTGRDVLALDHIGKRFGDCVLYRQLVKTVHSGDRIAIVGMNGIGKTTLLKIMAGELAPDEGTVRRGANVEMGYYAQHHMDLLDGDSSIIDTIWRMNPAAPQSYVRAICGALRFSGDDVDKSVGVLSGGERARVLLARMLIKASNVLLMDEPTNHLDLFTAEALADALGTFDGTLVFVSHNQSFVNRLATKVWDIGRQDVIEYPGNLQDYYRHRAMVDTNVDTNVPASASANQAFGPDGRPKQPGASKPSRRREDEKERRRLEAERRNQFSRQTKTLRGEIAELESRISKIEADQREIEPHLADPNFYSRHEDFRTTLRSYEDNRNKLEELYSRWEFKQEQLKDAEHAFANVAEI